MIRLNTNEISKKAQNLLKFSDGETTHLIYKSDKLCLQTRNCTAYVDTKNIGDKQVCIPQKAIAVINKIGSAQFEMEADEKILTIKYNRSSSKFQMNENFYEPNVFNGDIPEMNVIDKSLLSQIKKLSRYCNDYTQSANAATGGLYFNGNGKTLEVVATDGYRLIVFKTASKSKIKLIVPKKDIERIVALAISENVNIECCEIDAQKALFKIGDYTIVTATLIYEKFIDYKRALKFDTFPVTVNVAEMKSAIERIVIVNGNNKKPIILESFNSDIRIVSSANDTSKGSEYISASYNGDKEFRRGYNGVWFADMLSNYNGDVDIYVGVNSKSPIYIENNNEDSSLLTMIFPMIVRDMK